MGVLALSRGTASSIPPLAALGGFLGLYLVSAYLHDSGKHPALSNWLNLLPKKVSQSVFLYPIGILIPVIVSVAWGGSILVTQWLGPVLAGLAMVYIGSGQLLRRYKAEYRFPFHLLAYFIGTIAIGIAFQDRAALMTTLYINVAALGTLAAVYNRLPETILAGLLFIWPFQLSLNLSAILPHAHSFAYILLASLGYIPLGLLLKRRLPQGKHHLPLLMTGYIVSLYALISSLLGRFGIYIFDIQWVGVLVPLIAAAFYVFSAYLVHGWFTWAAVTVFPIAFGQGLTLFNLPPAWDSVAWVSLGIVYLVLGWVSRINEVSSTSKSDIDDSNQIGESPQKPDVHWNWWFNVGAWALASLGFILTTPMTGLALFSGQRFLDNPAELVQPMIAQWIAIAFVIISALQYRKRWPLFLEPVLAYLAVTLLFIGYGEVMIRQELTSAKFGIVWAALGAVHVIIAAGIEQAQKRLKTSYMHGIYLGGYILMVFAIFWALRDQAAFLWALGIWVVMSISSAVHVHFNRHIAWQETVKLVFQDRRDTLTQVTRSAFIWLAAWTFPIWLVVWLNSLRLVVGYQWLGLTASGLAYLMLTVWLNKLNRFYTWPLHLAAHTYNAIGLVISMPFTIITFGGGGLF
jgi:hypothetical protein